MNSSKVVMKNKVAVGIEAFRHYQNGLSRYVEVPNIEYKVIQDVTDGLKEGVEIFPVLLATDVNPVCREARRRIAYLICKPSQYRHIYNLISTAVTREANCQGYASLTRWLRYNDKTYATWMSTNDKFPWILSRSRHLVHALFCELNQHISRYAPNTQNNDAYALVSRSLIPVIVRGINTGQRSYYTAHIVDPLTNTHSEINLENVYTGDVRGQFKLNKVNVELTPAQIYNLCQIIISHPHNQLQGTTLVLSTTLTDHEVLTSAIESLTSITPLLQYFMNQGAHIQLNTYGCRYYIQLPIGLNIAIQ